MVARNCGMNRKLARIAACCLCACLMLVALPGCDEDVSMNTDFSIHLVSPGPKWPKKPKKLTTAQQEVLARYGRPDQFRIFYNRSGVIQTRSELGKELMAKKPKQLPPHSWIYAQRGVEVVFEGSSFREQPLTDQVRILMSHGDPEEVKLIDGGIQWMFFGAGKLYKFSPNGRIVEEKSFPAMGTFIKS